MSSAPCNKCYTEAHKYAKENGLFGGEISIMCDCDEIATRQNLARIQALNKMYPHAQRQQEQLARNDKDQETYKNKIAEMDAIINAKVPGTIRVAKQTRKMYAVALKETKLMRGSLYNGGVW